MRIMSGTHGAPTFFHLQFIIRLGSYNLVMLILAPDRNLSDF